MKPAKILVTGANGFVGQALCRRLMALEYEVYGLDKSQPVRTGFADFYSQDITKPFALKENFDFVFHLAAHNVTHVGSQDVRLYHKVNVAGTENVLKAAAAHHFVFLSTAKVYLAEGKPLYEDSFVFPLQEYEKSKWQAEQVCQKIWDPKRLGIFRSVSIVGPNQPAKAVIPVFFTNARAGKPLKVFGPKQSVLQFLFIEDLADAFVKVIENENVSGVFNIAGKEHICLDQLAQKIIKMCGSHSPIEIIPREKTPFGEDESTAGFSQVICAKVEGTLGWKAKATIQEILESY